MFTSLRGGGTCLAGVAKLEAAACGAGAPAGLSSMAAGTLAAAMDQLALVRLA